MTDSDPTSAAEAASAKEERRAYRDMVRDLPSLETLVPVLCATLVTSMLVAYETLAAEPLGLPENLLRAAAMVSATAALIGLAVFAREWRLRHINWPQEWDRRRSEALTARTRTDVASVLLLADCAGALCAGCTDPQPVCAYAALKPLTGPMDATDKNGHESAIPETPASLAQVDRPRKV